MLRYQIKYLKLLTFQPPSHDKKLEGDIVSCCSQGLGTVSIENISPGLGSRNPGHSKSQDKEFVRDGRFILEGKGTIFGLVGIKETAFNFSFQ